MRIAIDYTAATREAAGIGNYVRSLVDAMLAQDASNQYTLLTSGRPPSERPFPVAKNVRGRSLVIPDRYLNILWYRWRLPISATFFTGQVDIYHGPDFVLPPLNGTPARSSPCMTWPSSSIPNTLCRSWPLTSKRSCPKR
jgi:hypothetical protein